MDGEPFDIRYHDMPDVIDFIVLRQTYDTAMRRNWKPHDRFRSIIDDAWWMGTIESQAPLQREFPDSMFQCFIVTWDNGETERMSPWDFEPIDCNRMPDHVGGAVPVTFDERRSLVYRPKANEWPRCGRDTCCIRLVNGVSRIMELSIAEPFAAPVDLNAYPMYARIVAYPIDLSTIRARLENRFYRRMDSVRFDVKFLEINAKKFNEPNSKIVQKAVLLTNLLLQFINNQSCQDPIKLYQQLVDDTADKYHSSSAEEDDIVSTDAEVNGMGPSSSSVKRKKASFFIKSQFFSAKDEMVQASCEALLSSCRTYCSGKWLRQSTLDYAFAGLITKAACRKARVINNAVRMAKLWDYSNIIDMPMDLSTVRDRLTRDLYPSPVEFCKDMRLIFANSRNYNTNKKSRIYSMTIRMSALFEERIRQITSDWRSAVKRHPAAVLDFSSDSQPSSSRTSGHSSQAGTSSSTTRSAVLQVKCYAESDSDTDEDVDSKQIVQASSLVRSTRSSGQGDRMVNGKKTSPAVTWKLQSSSSSETLSKGSRKRKATRYISSSDGDDSHGDAEEEAGSIECSQDSSEDENSEEQHGEEYDDNDDDSPPGRRRSSRRAARTNVIGSDDSSNWTSCSGESSSSRNTMDRRKKRENSSGESEMTTGSSEKSSSFMTDHDYGQPRRSSRKPCKTTSFSPETTVRSRATTNSKTRVQTRNRGQQKVRYREDEDSEWTGDSGDDEDGLDSRAREVLSVSSRGRLRKLSKHAARAMVAQ
ncbi:hypothetical protein HPB51_015936 [Rhipicephalus microplus]|uniref:Bromo domain-containing protein n=1 Tax=Rhipicephalus microplus TaxID=6941 RepID=A0A9J6DH46_RHIMP|nr:hypothetical protein HPB51_015936 [Rhipicephalus microplus]